MNFWNFLTKTENLGNFYVIPADTHDLNYGKYFSEGASGLSSIGEYNSATPNSEIAK